jgi:hypothetical protein
MRLRLVGYNMKTWKLINVQEFVEGIWHRSIDKEELYQGTNTIVCTDGTRFRVQSDFEVNQRLSRSISLLSPRFYQEIEQSDREYVLSEYPDADLSLGYANYKIFIGTKEIGAGLTITEAWHNAALTVAKEIED